MKQKLKTGRRQPIVDDRPASGTRTGADFPSEDLKWWREAIEGLIIAIVLALLIRGFEAEAFVIPTGSMAPTLMGRHKDVVCDQCGHAYQAGASLDAEMPPQGQIVMTICPVCGYPKNIDYNEARDVSFTGDRILVNKFAYDLIGRPERFDVIVFKNPQNAKQNYIKRLCGLPGETIRLFRGDVYVKRDGESEFTIARKPPRKLKTLLQLVHDTKHVPTTLDEHGLPPRWQFEEGAGWSTPDRNRTFQLSPSVNESWIRYRHIAPTLADWVALRTGEDVDMSQRRGGLVTDFYAYNSYMNAGDAFPAMGDSKYYFFNRSTGKNWVGDLALECQVEVQSEHGELLMELVEGGWRFLCAIDVSTGDAKLTINGGEAAFSGERKLAATRTNVKGVGNYHLLFSNVDDELRLWVNGSVISFDGPTTYDREDNAWFRPTYKGPSDSGDLTPLRFGGRGLSLSVTDLRVYRDVYYVAVKGVGGRPLDGDYEGIYDYDDITEIFRSPEQWSSTPLFDRLRSEEFELKNFEDDGLDQFFPMGDNSPQSQDARIWSSTHNYVERQFLIGEAVVVYWPHPWHARLPGSSGSNLRTFPVFPNFSRMNVIR